MNEILSKEEIFMIRAFLVQFAIFCACQVPSDERPSQYLFRCKLTYFMMCFSWFKILNLCLCVVFLFFHNFSDNRAESNIVSNSRFALVTIRAPRIHCCWKNASDTNPTIFVCMSRWSGFRFCYSIEIVSTSRHGFDGIYIINKAR